jgi:hypothetical protein
MKKIVLAISLALFSTGVKAQKSTAGNYNYKTECLGVELDGSQTVKAWGNGRNRMDAVEQAKKNAIKDVIFFGIREGKSECDKRPLVGEVNAQDKYQDYFNKFFTDNGPYLNFISLRDERISSKIKRDKKGARQSTTNGVIVRVLRADLRQKLIEDGIIKS